MEGKQLKQLVLWWPGRKLNPRRWPFQGCALRGAPYFVRNDVCHRLVKFSRSAAFSGLDSLRNSFSVNNFSRQGGPFIVTAL